MDADDDQSGRLVAIEPGTDVRKGPLAVDARVRPEVVEHDLPAQLRRSYRFRVEPAGRVERGRGAQYRQVARVYRTRHLLRICVRADEHREHGARDQHRRGDQITSPPTGSTTGLPLWRTGGRRH